MREVPYETDHDVCARSRRDRMYERINDFLARGGRGRSGRGGRGRGMMNRIGYRRNFDDMIFESAIDFWFDDVDFGEDKLWKYFNELK